MSFNELPKALMWTVGTTFSAGSSSASGAMSSTNTLVSQGIDMQRVDLCGIQLSWTGSNGSFYVDVSQDSIDGATGTWTDLGLDFSGENPAGSADTTVISISAFPFKFLRVRYVNTSGTATLTGRYSRKDA